MTIRSASFWPFAANSIWNLSIATSAVYVAAGLTPRTEVSQATDTQYYLLDATQTDRTMYDNSSGSPNANDTGTTPLMQGGKQVTISIADSFIVPVSSHNNGWAALSGYDDTTLIEGGSFCRPGAAGGDPVASVWGSKGIPYDTLTGSGLTGGLGGSGMSAPGGTIRLGEFTNGTEPSLDANIRHVLKGNLCHHQDSSAVRGGYNGYALGTNPSYSGQSDGPGFRWPATKADGYATDDGMYGRPLDSKGRAYLGVLGSGSHADAPVSGSVPAVRPGALLALRPSDVTMVSGVVTKVGSWTILSTPGAKIAWTMMNYGFYVVNDTGVGSRFALCTEATYPGATVPDVATEFQNLYGMAFDTGLRDTDWAKDIENIFYHLYVVDNNPPSQVGGQVGGAGRLQDANPIPPFTAPAGGTGVGFVRL